MALSEPAELEEVVEVDPPRQLEVSLLAPSFLQVLIDTPTKAKKPVEARKAVEEGAFPQDSQQYQQAVQR